MTHTRPSVTIYPCGDCGLGNSEKATIVNVNKLGMNELEAKFLIQDADVADLVEWLGSREIQGVSLETLEIEDRYFDTLRWQILDAGWAYRWRQASNKREVAFKAINGGAGLVKRREEIAQRVSVFPKEKHKFEPGPATDLLKHLGKIRPRELFRVRNRRRSFLVNLNGEGSVEVAIDEVLINATAKPGALAPGELKFRELELELKEGSEKILQQFAARLQDRFHFLPARLSKFERGIQTVGFKVSPTLLPGVSRLESSTGLELDLPTVLGADKPAADLARQYLLQRYLTMLVEEPKAWEGLDAEGVHRMRVSTRRLRAGLRTFKTILPGESVNNFARELKWIAGVLGKVRDLDVLLEHSNDFVTSGPEQDASWAAEFRGHLENRRTEERRNLLDCLSGSRYREFKSSFAAMMRDQEAFARDHTISQVARRSLGSFASRVLKEGRKISSGSPDDAVHELRIDCKRLRYLVEIYLPVFGKPLRQSLGRLKKLQNVLGEFQDACVAMSRLQEYAKTIPLTEYGRSRLLATGQLVEQQRLRALSHRARFHRAWKRFDRKGWRKELLSCLKKR